MRAIPRIGAVLWALACAVAWGGDVWAQTAPTPPPDAAALSAKSESAVRAYLDGDYPEAERHLNELTTAIGPSGERLYDLGLVRYRRGEIGRACADFMRARWWLPLDTDLQGNLRLCQKELPPFALPPVHRVLEMVAQSQRWLSLSVRLWAVAGLWCLTWLVWFAHRRWPVRPGLTGALRAVAAALLLWSGSSLLAEGVLRPAYVTVGTQLMSGKLQDAMQLRNIAAGNRALIVETDNDWTLIEIEGARGWVRTDTLAPYGAWTVL